MKKKYWELIIEKSNKKQTLPYVIGSKKILFPNSDFDTIENLLDEIINSENNEIYSMYYCPDIGEYVIFHNKHKGYLMNGLEIINPKTGKLKLVFAINMESFGKTFEKIKSELSNRYKSNVADEKFSYEKGKWEVFTEKEKNIILSFKNL
jgi:histidinol phosphatase-like enzyme